MRKLISIFSFVLLYITVVSGQAAIDIPLFANDGSVPAPGIELAVGLDLDATDGIDVALGEAALPPAAPGLDVRFQVTGATTYKDYRAPGSPAAFPFTGSIQHNILLQSSDPGNVNITIGYDLPVGAAMRITDKIGGGSLDIGPFTGTGVAVIPASFLGVFTSAWLYMDYTDIGPATPQPLFNIAPAFLDFGPVGLGLTSTQQVTVSNPGDADLEITSIISSNPQFTFSPAAPPIIIIAPLGSQVFDVTFSPTVLGAFNETITFTHNAGAPFELPVSGVGADAGPTFGVTPGSLAFPTLLVGTSQTRQLTVRNDGLSNTLEITLASVTDPVNYSITPAAASIPPFGTEVFTVTFAPLSAGSLNTDVVFATNATPPTYTVPVTGAGFIPAAKSGLVFEKDTAYVYENTYDIVEKIQLLDLVPGTELHALQFRLLSNLVDSSDNVILTFQSITKGSDISGNANWILETNVVRGLPINPNGASIDTIYVLLYNLTNTGALTLSNYYNLFELKYKTAKLPPTILSQKSSFNIFFAEGSTYNGIGIDITPSDPVLEVIVSAAGGGAGDVNGDGCVDILDLIMVVDHIVGRDSLDRTPGGEFDRANIAPWLGVWPNADPLPTPDLVVNVQDLAVIQWIILNNMYPNGQPLAPCGGSLPKFNGVADATVNIYINEEGISAYLDSKIGIRGAQIEFQNVVDPAENMVINTALGQGYYLRVNDLLRTLMYDRFAQKYIEDGVNKFMADMPFVITNSHDIALEKLILVDINQKKVMNVEVNLIYSTTTLPYDYILWQNFPNPFNPSTAVRFQVPKTSDVTVKIYDMLGQEVRTLFAGEVLRGTYTVDWDGMNNAGVQMSSGTYVYRMIAGEFVQSKKMLLLK